MKLTTRGLGTAVALTAVLLTGCGEKSPEELLASAQAYLAQKDSKAAVIELKSALQQQPGLAAARFLLGRTLLEDGNAVGAEVELRKALDFKYPESEVLPPLAHALILQGKGLRVIQDYAAVDLAQPAATAALKVTLASAYMQTGNKNKAQSALADALGIVPGFAPALLMQSRLRAAEHDIAAALVLVEQVIVKDPTSYEALQLKGDLLLFSQVDGASGLEAHRQALAQRKDWLPAHASILQVLLARRDLAAAKTQLDELKKVLPNHPQTKLFEARLAFLKEDYKTARDLTQLLLKVAPENAQVLLLAGEVELQAGALAQAESLASKAVQRAAEAAAARHLLARIFLRSGQESRATETLAPLLEKPSPSAETLSLAAQAALQAGDAKTAEAYFTRAAKLNPNDTRSRTTLALVQFSKGNSDLGFSQLQEIASSDKGIVADMAIISLHLRKRNYDAALKAIDSLERKQPDKPLASQLRGQALMARKDAAAARPAFAKALAIDPLYFPAAASLAALDLRDHKPEAAQKNFDKLLSADPKNVRALLAVAELRAAAGAGKEEIAGLLANAVKLNPTVPTPRLLLIELNLRTKDPKTALAVARDAVAALPTNPDLLDALGRAQMASGDVDQAIISFNKLVALQRRSPQPFMRLADAYLALKNPAAARDSLKRALETTPGFLPAQRGLVVVELAAGRPDQALAMARSVQNERPDRELGYLLAGDVEAFRNNWDAAAAAYRAGLKREASTELALKLHPVLLRAQKRAEAEAFATGWTKEHPQDAAFRSYLGELAIGRRDLIDAESHYLAVVKLQPDNVIGLNNLAWVTNKLKKPGAAAYAEKANSLRPGQPALMDTLAGILSDDGNVVKALDIEKKAVALAPEYAVARLALAKLYLKVGEKALAKAELDWLTKLGDKFAGQDEVNTLLKTQ